MRVSVVGTVAVTGERSDGAPADVTVSDAELGGRRARVVLAFLALAGGPVGADALASALWGDAAPATWPAALRGTIRSLRAALARVGGDGQRVVATVASGYALAPGVAVDVAEAAERVREAGALLAGGRARAAVATVAPVATLAGQTVLAGEDGDWLAPHRAAFAATVAEAQHLLAGAASELGEHPRAIAAARAAVGAAPLDERAHRDLIRVLDRAGDRPGAVQAYERCRALLADELGVDPSAETVNAYLDATGGTRRDTGAARVPTVPTSFVGRDGDAAALAAALRRPGLVTVVGPGGVGKSRLAAVVAARTAFEGGRFWIPLTAVAEDALVEVTAGLTMGVGGLDAAAALVARLAPLGPALLVLDGVDLVTDGAATLAAHLIESCPRLTVLATARAPLGLDGERVQALTSLAAPSPDDPRSVHDSAAVRLLLERARSAGSALTLDGATPELARAVVELCRQCDGLPLALEIAAAQLADTAVGDLVDSLSAGQRDRLRVVTAASHAQLDDAEAAVFRRFAALDGPVGLAFARGVLAGPGEGVEVAPERVVRILRELGARGLVNVDRTGPRWRYSQDDDVHAFAAERLAASGEQREVHRRLLDAVQALLPDDPGVPPAPFADAITAVLPSIRSVFAAALAGRTDRGRCLELAFRLHRYWAATSVDEGRFWLARLLAGDAAPPWRRYATYALGYLGYWAGDTDAALRDLRAAIEEFGDEPDPFVTRALIFAAGLLDDLDRPAEALELVHRSIAAAEPFGTDLYVAAAMGVGSVLSERGDPDAATHAAAAVTRCRADGSAQQLAALLPTAAMVCWQVGALAEARAYVAEALPMHTEHRRIARVVLLSAAAGLALADGDVPAALDFGRRADADGTELGIDREMPLIRAVLARALLRDGDDAAAADRALAAVDAAADMDVAFPLAIGLETVALVAHTRGAPPEDVARLLGTAAAIRDAGDRPAPATLRGDTAALPVGAPVPVADAVALCRRLLGGRR